MYRRPPRHRILGLPVDALGMEPCVELVAAAIRDDRRCRVMVNNANKSWLAARDERLREVLEEAELVIPEFATVWAAGVLGLPGVEFVSGILLMRRLLLEAVRRSWSCFFLGARAEVVDALVARLSREQPTLRIVGWHDGYLEEAESEKVREQLRSLRPDLLFVAMGSPRQEHWMAQLPEGSARVSVGVGGSFDVLAGLRRDTPRWMRGNGLEWIFRVSQDPRHYARRYLTVNPWFVVNVLKEKILGRVPLGMLNGGVRRVEAEP
ncbi:MAG TPA: WecB/TagA/CpsF family glycosyltransferase [Longimicrobiales bacterium]